MKNLIIAALMLSSASTLFADYANAETVFCPGTRRITGNTVINANVSNTEYVSGANCVLAANRLLTVSGEILSAKFNGLAPAKFQFDGSKPLRTASPTATSRGRSPSTTTTLAPPSTSTGACPSTRSSREECGAQHAAA